MENEHRNEVSKGIGQPERFGGGGSGIGDGQRMDTTIPDKMDFSERAKKRRERIEKLEARLQRAKARDSVATRKERNGQLFVWGAMVEGVYRDGSTEEREQLRQWAKRKLTDHRHLKRAESGFARIEDEVTESTNT